MKPCTTLARTLNNREITLKQDALFLYEFQRSALLALKEIGTLTETQFQYAAETLEKQYRNQSRNL